MSANRWRLKLAVGVLGLLLLALAFYNYRRVYCCAPIHLTLSGGNVCPLRTEMAQHICSDVHDAGVVLQCAPGTDSEEVCEAIDRGELDLGLVLGGFSSQRYPNVRQVAAFGVEPLHLLVHRHLLTGAPPSLELLRGRRVSLGEHGTNGAILADNLLRLANLEPSTNNSPGDFAAEYAREHDLQLTLEALRSASPADQPAIAALLPDAVFIVDSLPSPLVDELVSIGGYQLVPLPYATALHLDNRRDHQNLGRRLESSRLEASTIPAYVYGINPPMPAQDCPTFGLRLLLIANKKTPTTAILRMLRALDSGVAQRYHLDLDVVDQRQEFPLHAGSKAFAKSRKPMMVGELLEPLGDALSVVGAGAAGALALWGFVRGLRAVNADTHLRQIDRIERLLRGDERDENAPVLPVDFIDYLERRLADVKKAAIDDYAAGRMEGDEALVSILTLIADTRHLLVQRRKLLGHAAGHTVSHPGRRAEAA